MPLAPSAGTDWIALRQVKTASPVAVASASCNPSMAWSIAARSLPGETSTLAALENETSPMLYDSGSILTNALAASWAAWSRVGATSSERIDRDTSMAIITVARSSGCRASIDGRASAQASVSRQSRNAPAARCRR